MTQTTPGSSGGGSPTKACRKCEEVKPLEDFNLSSSARDGRQAYCRLCSRAVHKTRYQAISETCRAARRDRYHANRRAEIAAVQADRRKNPEVYMLRAARSRARLQGVPFALTPEDITIPERCPVLGIPMAPSEGRARAGSPSLDKIIPALGYVPGNVAVISHRANQIKNNATLDELEAVTAWLARHVAPAPSPRKRKNPA